VNPREIADLVHREVPLIHASQPVGEAVELVLESGLPALPVVDERECLEGIFGEREFITALFPGYVGSLKHAGFVRGSVDAALQKRQGCRLEPVSDHMNREHIDVAGDFSDLQLAEVFIHHRVLIVPVTDERRIVGVITRSEFFAALARRFIGRG
jgi:CBS domain-containing protein